MFCAKSDPDGDGERHKSAGLIVSFDLVDLRVSFERAECKVPNEDAALNLSRDADKMNSGIGGVM